MRWPRILIATLSGCIAFALLVGGAAVLWVELTQRDADGFYTSRQVPITAGAARSSSTTCPGRVELQPSGARS